MLIKPKKSILEIKPYTPGLSYAKGVDKVIKLSSNENPLGSSEFAKAAYKNEADNLFRYPDGSAALLRAQIGKTYDLNPEQIVCGAGSDEIISLLCFAYAGSDGDEVLYSEHGFLMYKISSLAAGAKPVSAPEINLKADIDSLLAKVTINTKILFLANPNNPTGSYLNKNELKKLRENLREDILLVIDGAYTEYVMRDNYIDGRELVDSGENTVMTRTFSKIHGLASLRLGWAYCPKSVANILNRVRGPFNVSSAAIKAGAAALKDKEFVENSKKHNLENLEFLNDELTKLGLKTYDSVANFILVKFPGGEKQAQAANLFLLENGVIVRDVSNYGLPDALRITVGTRSDNERVIELLKKI